MTGCGLPKLVAARAGEGSPSCEEFCQLHRLNGMRFGMQHRSRNQSFLAMSAWAAVKMCSRWSLSKGRGDKGTHTKCPTKPQYCFPKSFTIAYVDRGYSGDTRRSVLMGFQSAGRANCQLPTSPRDCFAWTPMGLQQRIQGCLFPPWPSGALRLIL